MVALATPHRLFRTIRTKTCITTSSAFIKSMRAATDAALYWLARMIDGGEDPSSLLGELFWRAKICGSSSAGAAYRKWFSGGRVIGLPECRDQPCSCYSWRRLRRRARGRGGIDAPSSEVRRGPSSRRVPSYLRAHRHVLSPGALRWGVRGVPAQYPGHCRPALSSRKAFEAVSTISERKTAGSLPCVMWSVDRSRRP